MDALGLLKLTLAVADVVGFRACGAIWPTQQHCTGVIPSPTSQFKSPKALFSENAAVDLIQTEENTQTAQLQNVAAVQLPTEHHDQQLGVGVAHVVAPLGL